MTIQTFFNDLSVSDLLVSSGIEIIAKTLLVTLVACLAIQLLRGSSAALRHLICVAAIIAALLVPVGLWVLPSWNLLPALAGNTVEVQPQPESLSVQENTEASSLVTSDAESLGSTGAVSPPFPTPDGNHGAVPQTNAWTLPTIGSILLIGWVVPALLFMLKIFRGIILLHVRSRQSSVNQDPRIDQFTDEIASLIATTKPQVFIENRQSLPMVWGIVQGRLYLPSDAEQWSDSKLRAVLLHELAHLKRRDPLTLLLGQVARAVYWFNPLVWILNRQLVLEQEVACDDQVLQNASDRAGYASTLLEMTTISHPSTAGSSISAAMAKPLQIERRIRFVLNEDQNRKPINALAATLTLAIFLGLAGFVSCLSASPADVGKRIAIEQESDDTEPHEKLVAAIEFLQTVQDENDQFASEDSMRDGTNSLGAIALTHVGEVADKENQARAIRKVAAQDLRTTYELSLQIIALCNSGNDDYTAKIKDSIKKLCDLQATAGVQAGGWSYLKAVNRADGSNTRFAVWAMAVAHEHGYEIPKENLELATQYWIEGEREGGGWGYVNGGFAAPTITMRLSGIVCLAWLSPMLEDDHPLQEKMAAAIVKAWSIEDWETQLKESNQWPFYSLHLCLLAVEATDWELEGLARDTVPTQDRLIELLVELQNENGSFGSRPGNFRSICTSLAVLIFEKG